jgi:hypothetical protein
MACCLLTLNAAAPSIGVVRSNGEFRVDGSPIRGNATLFEGNLVETAAAQSVLQLGPTQITLLPGSRVKVFRDHFEAGALRIVSQAADAAVLVQTPGANRVDVASRTGVAEVRNSAGMLVAMVSPGDSLSFDTQGSASTEFKMTGTLQAKDGKFFLTDSTAKVTVELVGPDLAQYIGKTVDVTGSSIPNAKVAAGAAQAVQVTSIKASSKKIAKAGAAAGAGAAAAGAGAAAAGTTAGLSTAAVVVIGGVAVGGTAGGLAAAGTFSSSPSVSTK